jgi:hypothetical protein
MFTAIPNLEMINLTIDKHGNNDVSLYGTTYNTGKIWTRTSTTNNPVYTDVWTQMRYNMANTYDTWIIGITALNAYIATFPNYSVFTVMYVNSDGSGLTNDHFTALPQTYTISTIAKANGNGTFDMTGYTQGGNGNVFFKRSRWNAVGAATDPFEITYYDSPSFIATGSALSHSFSISQTAYAGQIYKVGVHPSITSNNAAWFICVNTNDSGTVATSAYLMSNNICGHFKINKGGITVTNGTLNISVTTDDSTFTNLAWTIEKIGGTF